MSNASHSYCIPMFQELSGEVNQQRMQFDSLLSSCDLLETPFDQTQFENDVSQLQEKLAQCDKVSGGKKRGSHNIVWGYLQIP